MPVIVSAHDTRAGPAFQPVFRTLTSLDRIADAKLTAAFVAGFYCIRIPNICLSIRYLSEPAQRLQAIEDFFQKCEFDGSACKGCKEVPNFLVNLVLCTDRLGDFLPQQLAVATPQTMNGDLHRTLAHAKLLRHLAVGD